MNEKDKTASVCSYLGTQSDILVPKEVIHESKKYILTNIGDEAFTHSQTIQKINFSLDSELKAIGEKAFMRLSLVSIKIPSSVRKIGDYAFSFCQKLENIEFGDDSELVSIGKNAFEYSGLKQIKINPYQTHISESTFNECESFNKLIITANKLIKKFDFKIFGNIKSIQFASKIEDLEESSFEDLTTLEEILIPKTVKSIGKKTFKGCSSLNTLTIPLLVTIIEESVFEGCSSLKKILIHNHKI